MAAGGEAGAERRLGVEADRPVGADRRDPDDMVRPVDVDEVRVARPARRETPRLACVVAPHACSDGVGEAFGHGASVARKQTRRPPGYDPDTIGVVMIVT
jgi:hypothetical protein